MKEFTIVLPAKKEYTYVIQNKNTNCIFIRNYNPSFVTAGTKPYPHDTIIPPFRTGVISRPFPLDYIFLQADKKIPVEIYEAFTKNPADNLVQQEITKTINIKLEGVQTVNISRDKKNNIDVVIRNTPKIGQDAFKLSFTGPTHVREIEFDTGHVGKPIINFFAKPFTRYEAFFYNDWWDYYYEVLRPHRRVIFRAHKNNPLFRVTFNAFRYMRIRGGGIFLFPFQVIISTTR